MTDLPADFDPDRPFGFREPGSQEWWYFDAIADDGEYALVAVWYAGLPFDPSYGLAARRYLADPARHPAPDPLDHAAIGFSLYRRGKTAAYALNRYPADRWSTVAEPFAVSLAGSQASRGADGSYRLEVDTPSQDGKRSIRADLTFRPAPGTRPIARDFGGSGGPHHWILAAGDCRVEGTVALDGPRGLAIEFRGRGYHDHNAGVEELSLGWTRWRWGRVHAGSKTFVYYQAEPKGGRPHSTWIVLEDGLPVEVRDGVSFELQDWKRHPLGIRHARSLRLAGEGADGPRWRHRDLVDYGPFYLRWLSEFEVAGRTATGFAELLEADRLHNPLFNWMIPFRLKRPQDGKPRGG